MAFCSLVSFGWGWGVFVDKNAVFMSPAMFWFSFCRVYYFFVAKVVQGG